MLVDYCFLLAYQLFEKFRTRNPETQKFRNCYNAESLLAYKNASFQQPKKYFLKDLKTVIRIYL